VLINRLPDNFHPNVEPTSILSPTVLSLVRVDVNLVLEITLNVPFTVAGSNTISYTSLPLNIMLSIKPEAYVTSGYFGSGSCSNFSPIRFSGDPERILTLSEYVDTQSEVDGLIVLSFG